MKDYVVVDVETCNRERHICAISVLEVKDNQIVNVFYSLINPNSYFEINNTRVNGINELMVKDAPTFDVFYSNVSDVLTHNVIVVQGNNQFDLNAISKELLRYGLEIPAFRYLDTCSIAKEHLVLEEYGLSTLARYFNLEFEHHNALSDTEVTYKIFEQFNKEYDLHPLLYTYVPNIENNLKWGFEQINMISDLIGLIKGISSDGIINEQETVELHSWVEKARVYVNYNKFEIIIKILEIILMDGHIDIEERNQLIKLSEVLEDKNDPFSINHVRALQGILRGIIADNKLNVEEVTCLEKWLNESDVNEEFFALNELNKMVHDVLEDGIITNEEEKKLSELIKFIINPVQSTYSFSITDIEGKTFSLTQNFEHFSPRSVLENKIVSFGGKITNVTKKLDYLIIGSILNPNNNFGLYGNHIQSAIQNINNGSPTIIVMEKDLPSELFE